jgi:hypothetical protein
MVERPQPGLLDRAATTASWVLGGALFLTVGWFAMEPDDPLGPVSAYARQGGLMMLTQAAALSGVAAGLATLIAGRRVADIGTFAASLGLAAVSVRGATAEYLLLRGADASETFEHSLAWSFAIEAVGWFLVVLVAIGVSALVMRWCFGSMETPDSTRTGASPGVGRTLAGFDVPRVSARFFGVSGERQTVTIDGVHHMLITTGVGLAAMAVLSAGLRWRSIQDGQVCFVVAAAVFIGTYAACRMVPVRSALWSILAVGLIALVGYLWAALRPEVTGLPPNIPSSHFLRILPIQFIAVGTTAALMAFWYVSVPDSEANSGPGDGGRAPERKGGA